MEVPGIEPATSWLVVRHADPYTNEAILIIIIIVIIIIIIMYAAYWQVHVLMEDILYLFLMLD